MSSLKRNKKSFSWDSLSPFFNVWIILALGLSLALNGYLLRQKPSSQEKTTVSIPVVEQTAADVIETARSDRRTHAFISEYFETVFLFQKQDDSEPIETFSLGEWGNQLGITAPYQKLKRDKLSISYFARAAFDGDMRFIPLLGKSQDQYSEKPIPNPPELLLDSIRGAVFSQTTPEFPDSRIVARFIHPNGKYAIEVSAPTVADMVQAFRNDLTLATFRFLNPGHTGSLTRWQGLQGDGFTVLFPAEWYKENSSLRFSSGEIKGSIRFRRPGITAEGSSEQRLNAYLAKLKETDTDIIGFSLTKKPHPIPGQEQFEITVQRKVAVKRENQVERWLAVTSKDKIVIIEASIHPLFLSTFDKILETVHLAN